MEPKYKIGQKVKVRNFKSNSSVFRDVEISQYANETGMVTNYYFMSPNRGKVFCIYTILLGEGQKDIVLHENEIK